MSPLPRGNSGPENSGPHRNGPKQEADTRETHFQLLQNPRKAHTGTFSATHGKILSLPSYPCNFVKAMYISALAFRFKRGRRIRL